MLSLDVIKKQATILKNFLSQNNTSITHSSCLNAIAKINGYKDWNTLSAHLKQNETGNPSKQVLKLNLEPAIVEGALYALLQQACGIDSNPNNFIAHRNKEGEVTGFEIKLYDQKVVIDGNLRFNSDNPIKRMFILGIQLGTMIEEILTEYNSEVFSDKKTFNKKPHYEIDIGGLVKFSENMHLQKRSSQVIFSEGVNPNDHPKLLELKSFIEKQEPVTNTRVFLIVVKEMLDEHYYISWGGMHINIKKFAEPEGEVLALIVNDM